MENQIKVKLNQASNVRVRNKSYTLYEIRVQSNTFFPWLLHKRYREFEALHQAMKQAKSQLSLKGGLPDFPPKKYTSRFSREVVEQRRDQLEQYLQGALKSPEYARLPEFLDFLDIPENVRSMLGTRNQVPILEEKESPDDDQRGSSHLSPEQQEIHKLLRQMSLGQHRVRAIQSFTDFFFEHRPRLNPRDIDMLLKGNDSHPGIIKNCGDSYYSTVSRRAALALLVRLLDIERNKDANNFLNRFCELRETVLRELSLEQHITSMHNQLDAFKLVYIIKRRSPHLARELLKSDMLEQQYLIWERLQAEAPIPVLEHKAESQVEAENLADRSFEAIGVSCWEKVREVIQDTEDWKQADLDKTENVEVQCQYKMMESKAMEPEEWRMKAVLRGVPAPPKKIAERMFSNQQTGWNRRIVKTEVIKTLDDRHKLVYQVFSKPFYSADSHNQRDFCLLETFREENPNTYWLLYTSVDHRAFPEPKDCIRTISKPIGWKISPTKGSQGQASDVTFAALLTGTTILLVSSDLLGDNNDIVQFFHRLQSDFSV